jgi:hypothetical protein
MDVEIGHTQTSQLYDKYFNVEKTILWDRLWLGTEPKSSQ